MLTDTSIRLSINISVKVASARVARRPFYRTGQCLYQRQRAATGDQVVAGDVVKVNGRLIEPREADVLIALTQTAGSTLSVPLKTANAIILVSIL